MMKTKKLVAVVLALVLVLAMGIPTYAAADITEHKFVAYQIFAGTQADSAELGNPVWTQTDIEVEDLINELQTTDAFGTSNPFATLTAEATAADVIEIIGEWTDNSENANAFAKIVAKHVVEEQGDAVTYDKESGKYTATLANGYYVIVDETEFAEGETNTFWNASVLEVTNTTLEIKVKTDLPSVEKKVEENQDNIGYNDVADYSIGDTVPFKYTSAVPDMSAYETYKYVFHDTMDEGLTFDASSVKISIGGTAVTSGYTLIDYTNSEPEKPEGYDGCTFEIVFKDLKTVTGAIKDAKIEVTYNATLNEKAKIGSEGNKNTVELEYSNNPDDGGEGTGRTPEDAVIVFTYELDIDKYDGANRSKLDGVTFILSRKVTVEGTETTQYAVIENNKLASWNTDKTKATSIVTANGGKAIIQGLEDGTYYLEETVTLNGYNLPTAPFTVEIVAVTNNGQNIAPTDLSSALIDSTAITTDVGPDGIHTEKIENNKGAVLPETGAMGTIIFTVVGCLLIGGTAILLITRKKMSVYEED